MSGGVTFDTDFATSTIDHYLNRTVRDQVFNDFGLLGFLESRVGIDRVSGGDNILVPLNTAKSNQVNSYAGYDPFTNTPQETLTNAVFGWKQYYASAVAQGLEVERNRSPEGMINMWAHKVQLALKSLRDSLNVDAFGTGTGNGGKDILGIDIGIDSAGTYGGISRAANSYWQAVETASGGTLAVQGATGLLLTLLTAAPGSRAMGMVDAHWTTPTIYEIYHDLFDGGVQYTTNERADGAFGRLLFRGVPVDWDHAATAQTWYGIASETWKMYIHPARNFMQTEIATARNNGHNADAVSQRILWAGELICQEPRRNFKLTGITT